MRNLFFIIIIFIFSLNLSAEEYDNSFTNVIEPPKLLSIPKLIYPDGITVTGIVKVSAIINETGYPEGVSVVEKLHPLADTEAVSYVSKMVFEPAKENKNPIKVKVVIPVFFQYVVKKKPGRIDGVIFEKGTGKPLFSVAVHDSLSGKEIYTDKSGIFSIESVKYGKRRISVSLPNYYPYSTSEVINEGMVRKVKYYIVPENYSPYSIDVLGVKPKKEVSEITLSIEEVKKVAGVGGDPIKVVQRLPGVTMVNELSGAMVVRGSGPYDNIIMIDGITVPYVFHMGDFASVLNSELLKSVDFYAGGFSVKYGDAMGGVIDVKTKEPDSKKFKGSLSVGTIMTEGSINIPFKNTGTFIGGRRSYIDILASPVIDKVGNNNAKFTVFPFFYDYQLKSSYKLKNNKFTLLVFGAKDAMGVSMAANPCDDVDRIDAFSMSYYFNRIVSQWDYTKGKVLNKLIFYTGDSGNGIVLGKDMFLNLDYFSNSLRDYFTYKFSNLLSLSSGIAFYTTKFVVDSYFVKPPSAGDRTYSFEDAEKFRDIRIGYAYYSWFFSELEYNNGWLKVYPGIRYGYLSFSEENSIYFDPRIRFRLSITKNDILKGAIGKFSQFPSGQQLDTLYGNPNLAPEKAIHYVLGYEKTFTDFLAIELQLYYKDIYDLVISDAGFSKGYENTGKGYSYGGELFLRRYSTPSFPLWGWLSYSFSKSKRKYLSDSPWIDYSYDRPNTVNLVVNYSFKHFWQIGGSWRYSSGRPYTKINGSINLIDNNMYIPLTGDTNTERGEPYHRLDVRIEKKVLFNRWYMELFADLYNVYFHMNPINYLYDYDYANRTPVVLVPFLLNLGIKGVF